MKQFYLVFFCCSVLTVLRSQTNDLPIHQQAKEKLMTTDWLVRPVFLKANIYKSPDGKDIIFYNGLVKRSFRLAPNLACIEYSNMMNGQQLLRSIKPEAIIKINGRNHNVGGLYGQKENAYLLPEWIDNFQKGENDFQFTRFDISELIPFLNWPERTESDKVARWWSLKTKPATGKRISFTYQNTMSALKDIVVKVNYDLYDGLPLIVKWLTIENKGSVGINIDGVTNEILGLVEEESAVVGSARQMKKPQGIYVETNYAFNNAMRYDISDQTMHWKTDSNYTSQVNYDYQTPCLLEIYPEKAPGIELKSGENFTSVHSYELLMDSYDRERRGLAIRSMYRTIAPWTSANPVFMHLVSKKDEEVKNAIDQCVATGYEALILSFGSHLNMEDSSASNIRKWKELTAYAHDRGLKLGGYSLFSSRRISDEDDVVDPKTGKPGGAFFGHAPCFGSKWGLAYRDKIKYFFTQTGFDIWENDGPYPGDICASVTHPGHKGLEDSQWRQMEIQKELYHWLNEKSIYVNAPDWYFLDGTNKIGIGYREVNFSLPRENQKILNRQNIFDGTWEKTPSMSWGFVPLTRYQGGGPEAVLEPLNEHLKDYEQLMMQYYGAGVQACYRGPRLYDTEATKQTVIRVINWYKKYRAILNSDIIHLRRADGRDWDGILHVNPQLKTKGLMMIYNPLKEKMTRTIKVPLYYAGLTNEVKIGEKESKKQTKKLDRNYEIELTFTIDPESYTWFVIE
jgi:hypothetical protein